MKRTTFLCLIVLLAGCGPGDDGHDHAGQKKDEAHEELHLTEEQQSIADIKTTKVTTSRIQPELTVPGTISATVLGKAVVTPPIAGRVVDLAVSLGQTVRKGQVLATLESTELAEAWSRITGARRAQDDAVARLRESESQVRIGQARLESAKQTLERQRALAAAGAFSQAPLQQAQSELNDAQSELLSAQNEQASHAEQLRRMENLFRDGIVSKSEYDAALLEAQQDVIRVNRATSRVQSARATLEREKRIAERGLLNSREVQTAEADVRNARLEIERAQAVVRSSRISVASAMRSVEDARNLYRTTAGGYATSSGRLRLVSPISGVVSRFDVSRGQAVDRTQTLFEIEDLSTVWATAQVPEREAGSIRKGMRVRVSASAFPDVEFEGITEVVDSRLDTKTRSLAVRCRLLNSGHRLKPEMFVEVRIPKGEDRMAISVPKSAIVFEGGKRFVYVKREDGFHREEIQAGQEASESVEVLSGLKAGDEVATSGAFVLKSQEKKDELKGHEH